jgi:BMFP domain-containing protein YqiC
MKPAPPVTRIMAPGYKGHGAGAEAACGRPRMKEACMNDRPRLLGDLAGIAGGAVSALSGLRDEAEALVRARVDEALRRMEVVRREEFDAMAEMLARTREAQEAAEARLAAVEAKLEALTRKPGGGGPGMIA